MITTRRHAAALYSLHLFTQTIKSIGPSGWKLLRMQKMERLSVEACLCGSDHLAGRLRERGRQTATVFVALP